jgi:hypothetical protein
MAMAMVVVVAIVMTIYAWIDKRASRNGWSDEQRRGECAQAATFRWVITVISCSSSSRSTACSTSRRKVLRAGGRTMSDVVDAG